MRAALPASSRADHSRNSNGAKPKTLLATAAFSISRLQRWLGKQIVQDLPSDVAVCECDCRKTQCTSVEWEACEIRFPRPVSPSIHWFSDYLAALRSPNHTGCGEVHDAPIFQGASLPSKVGQLLTSPPSRPRLNHSVR